MEKDAKEEERQMLKRDTEEFIKNGGIIEKLPYQRITVQYLKQQMMKDDWRYKRVVEYRQRELENASKKRQT